MIHTEVQGDDFSRVTLGKALVLLETETTDLPWAGPSDPQKAAHQGPDTPVGGQCSPGRVCEHILVRATGHLFKGPGPLAVAEIG